MKTQFAEDELIFDSTSQAIRIILDAVDELHNEFDKCYFWQLIKRSKLLNASSKLLRSVTYLTSEVDAAFLRMYPDEN
jgi:hypothetical protein